MTFVACTEGWDLDETTDGNYRRCLKLLTDDNGPIRKTWNEAYDECKTEGSTLVKLAPKKTDKLIGILKNNTFFCLSELIYFVKKSWQSIQVMSGSG